MTFQVNHQSLIPSTDMIQLTLTLKMTTTQVVEMSITVNNNSPIQDYVHPRTILVNPFMKWLLCLNLSRTIYCLYVFLMNSFLFVCYSM